MRRTLTMRSFWSDPYLWVHLAGLASVPLWLELCLLGLAVGDPILPSWLELFLVGTIGAAPLVWMQWQRPFNIFSLLILALKPEQLTENQWKLLTLFQAQRNRFLAVGVAIAALFILRQIYYIAPIAETLTPFGSSGRLVGLLIAAIAFLGTNLFLQVPVAVLSVLFNSESVFAATLPYPTDQIYSNFTFLGFPVNQVLPPLTSDTVSQPQTVPVASPTPSVELSKIASDATSNTSTDDPWLTEDEVISTASVTTGQEEATASPIDGPSQPDEKADTQSAEIASEEVTTEGNIASPLTEELVSQVTSETALSDPASPEASSIEDSSSTSDPTNSL